MTRIAASSAEVGRIVASLLRDLDDGASALLAAASVLGADFDSGLAAAVPGTSQERRRSACRRRGLRLVSRPPDRSGPGGRPRPASARQLRASRQGPADRVRASAAAALEPLAWRAPGRVVRSRRTCCGRHLTRPPSGGRSAGPRRRRRRRRRRSRSRSGPVSGHRADRGRKRGRRRSRARGAADRAGHGGDRAGQLAASLRHAVAAADAAERNGRLDLVAGAALVVRGIGHAPVALTLLGLCDRALADDGGPAARRARLLAQRASALASSAIWSCRHRIGDGHGCGRCRRRPSC